LPRRLSIAGDLRRVQKRRQIAGAAEEDGVGRILLVLAHPAHLTILIF
jgi:hypothetical protein